MNNPCLQFVCFIIFENTLIRASLCLQQDDTVSYINGALKEGTQLSCFRKDKLGKDGNGNSYW